VGPPRATAKGKEKMKEVYKSTCPECHRPVTISRWMSRNQETRYCRKCSPASAWPKRIKTKGLVEKLQITAFQTLFNSLQVSTSTEQAFASAVALTSDESMCRLKKTPQFRKYFEMMKGNNLCKILHGNGSDTVMAEKNVAAIDCMINAHPAGKAAK